MKIRSLILTALFAAITAAGAWLRIPMPPSAITLQFLCAAMAGVLLGKKYGALSQAVYTVLGLAGLPVFSQGGGIGYVLQPTFGFTLGLIAAAWITGRLAHGSHSPGRIALACTAGLGALYAVGLPYMALILNAYLRQAWTLRELLWAGMLPFLPGDAVKILLCCLVCPRLTRHLDKMHE